MFAVLVTAACPASLPVKVTRQAMEVEFREAFADGVVVKDDRDPAKAWVAPAEEF